MTRHFSLGSQNSEYPRIFRVTGANRNARKLLSTDLVNTKPVSYTHLRAHETRSNLVCRLLLEKKKRFFDFFF